MYCIAQWLKDKRYNIYLWVLTILWSVMNTFLFVLSSLHAGVRPGDLSEPDRQHRHRAAETRPKQGRTCEVGLYIKVARTAQSQTKNTKQHIKTPGTTVSNKNKKIKHFVFISVVPWGEVAGEFCISLYLSHLLSFICLCLVDPVKKKSRLLKMRTKPSAAKASFRISSLMYTAAHPEPPRASGEPRNSVRLMVHLLVIIREAGTAALFKCQVVGQSHHFWLTEGNRGLLVCLIIFLLVSISFWAITLFNDSSTHSRAAGEDENILSSFNPLTPKPQIVRLELFCLFCLSKGQKMSCEQVLFPIFP